MSGERGGQDADPADERPGAGWFRPVADSLAWGAVSGLSFLVLAFGYRLATSGTPDVAALFAVAVVVAILGAVGARLAARRLPGVR